MTSNIKKIGIDARFFGIKDKGIGRYVENLIRNLEKINSKNQYFIFLRKSRWNDYWPQNPNFKKILINHPFGGWGEQILLSFKLKKYRLDLIHFTYFNIPIFYKRNFIVTIHDLTLRYFPAFKKNLISFLFYPLKKLAYYLVFGSAIKRAEKIIAVSNFTKREILKKYKLNLDKIKVIYEGVTKKQKIKDKIEKTQIKYKKPYLLYVGNAYPHKNLERLILAFAKLRQQTTDNRQQNLQDLQLVLVGGEEYFYKKLKNSVYCLPLAVYSNIIFSGFVSDEELDKLYRNATLYVFPSLYEGFGLPSLEAMARGVPVAASDATCLPEILGEAAIYFNPLDVNDMAEKIAKTLSNDRVKKDLIQRGYQQIKKYSWQEMAKETLNIYKLF